MYNLPFFRLEKNNKILFWLGIQHSRDPQHSQWESIKEKWQQFLKEAKSPMVAVEHILQDMHDTEELAITNGGEVEFIGFLAKQIGVPVVCFEPDRHLEINYLAKLFGREKTAYYYFARAVAQWYRLNINIKIPIEQYIPGFLKRDAKVADWEDFEFSIENLKHIHKNLFGVEIDWDDASHFRKIANPTREDNPLGSVVRACGAYRDEAVINNVKLAWNKNDIFMIYGNGHRKGHERRLRS